MLKIHFASLALLVAIILSPAADAAVDKREKQREEIRTMARQTIEQLYEMQPRARQALEGAAGYAVFDNFGMKLLLGGGGSGSGVAIERESRKLTYMKMVDVHAGIGFRVNKHRQIWVFENVADLENFINSGWDFGGQTSVSAKLDKAGGSLFSGAISVRPGIWVYQLSDSGLALDLTAKGTKYYPNKALN